MIQVMSQENMWGEFANPFSIFMLQRVHNCTEEGGWHSVEIVYLSLRNVNMMNIFCKDHINDDYPKKQALQKSHNLPWKSIHIQKGEVLPKRHIEVASDQNL